ncbi:hypothetical protein GCM10009780_27410 [Actinomadura alba]
MVWGPRSSTKRDSFWLLPPVLIGDPVRVRAFDRIPDRGWIDPARGVPLTVANFRDRAEATFVLPSPPPAAVAVDIDLRLEVDSVRGSGLRLRQLFTVGATGSLMPSRYVRRDVTVTVAPNAGVTIADRPPVELVGRHPLLTATTNEIRVDAEFLDVTELWWELRARHRTSPPARPRGDWYVHPALGGRPERLRILAATTPGKGPMLWMTWASREAVAPAQKIQPLIFLIAPAWLNGGLGFKQQLSASGLTAAAAGGAPLLAVGRFLLSSVPSARLDAVRKAAPRLSEQELWQLATDVLRATVPGMPGMAKGALWPEKLLETAAGGGATARAVLPLLSDIGHRPAGHEAAADDSGKPLLLVYPVGVDPSEPYVSVQQAGLAERMSSLVGTLFGAGAVASAATAAPVADELILAGHSSGNIAMWASLSNNGADIVKCVAFDAAAEAVPESHTTEIGTGVARRKGRPVTLVLVTSPNSFGSQKTLTDRMTTVGAAMRANPAAKLVMLPARQDQAEFWDPTKVRPTTAPTKNPLLRSMLAGWSDAEVTGAARQRGWGFLFFHEFAAYGGQSPTRTFFREALDL